MNNKDLNYIAGLEKAIKQKYGEEAVQNPSSNWTPEKEKEYLQQLKENKVKEMTADRVEEHEGFLFSAKLIKKDSKSVCDVCSNILKQQDMLYETKYECCRNCYIQHVEGREDRWEQGWRPDNV
tara:strand:+ start:147 stop:518 length:372 start_codon:yes stop_codon:yes gene_type:complete